MKDRTAAKKVMIQDVTDLSPDLAVRLGMRPRRSLAGMSCAEAYAAGLEDAYAVSRIRAEAATKAEEAERQRRQTATLNHEAEMQHMINALSGLLTVALRRGPDSQ
jgi:hypothetical protein